MFRLMEKARNNKGFSLVELIVVVLIIAIIAVALAPQVVKYVGTARDNVTANNAATIKSAVQAAVAEYQGTDPGATGNKTLVADKYNISATKSEVTQVGNTVNTGLQALIEENLGTDNLDTNYKVTIDGNGTVTVEEGTYNS